MIPDILNLQCLYGGNDDEAGRRKQDHTEFESLIKIHIEPYLYHKYDDYVNPNLLQDPKKIYFFFGFIFSKDETSKNVFDMIFKLYHLDIGYNYKLTDILSLNVTVKPHMVSIYKDIILDESGNIDFKTIDEAERITKSTELSIKYKQNQIFTEENIITDANYIKIYNVIFGIFFNTYFKKTRNTEFVLTSNNINNILLKILDNIKNINTIIEKIKENSEDTYFYYSINDGENILPINFYHNEKMEWIYIYFNLNNNKVTKLFFITSTKINGFNNINDKFYEKIKYKDDINYNDDSGNCLYNFLFILYLFTNVINFTTIDIFTPLIKLYFDKKFKIDCEKEKTPKECSIYYSFYNLIKYKYGTTYSDKINTFIKENENDILELINKEDNNQNKISLYNEVLSLYDKTDDELLDKILKINNDGININNPKDNDINYYNKESDYIIINTKEPVEVLQFLLKINDTERVFNFSEINTIDNDIYKQQIINLLFSRLDNDDFFSNFINEYYKHLINPGNKKLDNDINKMIKILIIKKLLEYKDSGEITKKKIGKVLSWKIGRSLAGEVRELKIDELENVNLSFINLINDKVSKDGNKNATIVFNEKLLINNNKYIEYIQKYIHIYNFLEQFHFIFNKDNTIKLDNKYKDLDPNLEHFMDDTYLLYNDFIKKNYKFLYVLSKLVETIKDNDVRNYKEEQEILFFNVNKLYTVNDNYNYYYQKLNYFVLNNITNIDNIYDIQLKNIIENKQQILEVKNYFIYILVFITIKQYFRLKNTKYIYNNTNDEYHIILNKIIDTFKTDYNKISSKIIKNQKYSEEDFYIPLINLILDYFEIDYKKKYIENRKRIQLSLSSKFKNYYLRLGNLLNDENNYLVNVEQQIITNYFNKKYTIEQTEKYNLYRIEGIQYYVCYLNNVNNFNLIFKNDNTFVNDKINLKIDDNKLVLNNLFIYKGTLDVYSKNGFKLLDFNNQEKHIYIINDNFDYISINKNNEGYLMLNSINYEIVNDNYYNKWKVRNNYIVKNNNEYYILPLYKNKDQEENEKNHWVDLNMDYFINKPANIKIYKINISNLFTQNNELYNYYNYYNNDIAVLPLLYKSNDNSSLFFKRLDKEFKYENRDVYYNYINDKIKEKYNFITDEYKPYDFIKNKHNDTYTLLLSMFEKDETKLTIYTQNEKINENVNEYLNENVKLRKYNKNNISNDELIQTKKELGELINNMEIINFHNTDIFTHIYTFRYLYYAMIELDNMITIIDKINNNVPDNDIQTMFKLSFDEDYIYNENRDKKYIVLTEIMAHNFMWDKQHFIIDKIINNYHKDKVDVYQLIMGSGKSKMITPALLIYFLYSDRPQTILVLPQHLIKQAKETIEENFKLILCYYDYNNITSEYIKLTGTNNKKLLIISDNDYKSQFLQGIYKNDSESLFIFDEFDTMYDPMRSELNISTLENTKSIDEELLDMINEITEKCLIFLKDKSNFKNQFINNDLYQKDNYKYESLIYKKLVNAIKFFSTKKYNKDYGFPLFLEKEGKMSHRNPLLAVPYDGPNSPIIDSVYTDIDYLIISTIFSYYYTDNDNVIIDLLYEQFIKKFINTKLVNIITESELNKTLKTKLPELNITVQKLRYNIREYIKIPEEKKIEYLKQALKYLFTTINFPIKIKNMSFIDLMSEDVSKYKIGFSGTTSLLLPQKITDEYIDTNLAKIDNYVETNSRIMFGGGEFKNIQSMKIDNGNMYMSYLGYHEESEIHKIDYSDENVYFQEILKLIQTNKYNTLIDAAGMFIKLNTDDIVSKLLEIYDKVIYIDNIDNIYVKTKDKQYLYDNRIYDDAFCYFDYKHIIGTDIKLKLDSKGLVTVNYSSIFSKITQGIYRMRKINETQRINFILPTSKKIKIDNTYNLLRYLLNRENMKIYSQTEITKLKQIIKKNNRSTNNYEIIPYNIFNKEYILELLKPDNVDGLADRFNNIFMNNLNTDTSNEQKYINMLYNKLKSAKLLTMDISTTLEVEQNVEQDTQQDIEQEVEINFDDIKSLQKTFFKLDDTHIMLYGKKFDIYREYSHFDDFRVSFLDIVRGNITNKEYIKEDKKDQYISFSKMETIRLILTDDKIKEMLLKSNFNYKSLPIKQDYHKSIKNLLYTKFIDPNILKIYQETHGLKLKIHIEQKNLYDILQLFVIDLKQLNITIGEDVQIIDSSTFLLVNDSDISLISYNTMSKLILSEDDEYIIYSLESSSYNTSIYYNSNYKFNEDITQKIKFILLLFKTNITDFDLLDVLLFLEKVNIEETRKREPDYGIFKMLAQSITLLNLSTSKFFLDRIKPLGSLEISHNINFFKFKNEIINTIEEIKQNINEGNVYKATKLLNMELEESEIPPKIVTFLQGKIKQ
jgi:hypothetical protein